MSFDQPSPRQTLSYLRELFEARGLRPKNKLGQSFLIDLNLMDLIIRVADLTPADLVLEVGTGAGSLTTRLAERAGAVLGIEIDAGLFELAREITAARPNVKILNLDILKSKHQINADVLQAIREALGRDELKRLKLVANLPYVVATPVITNLLLTDLPFELMVTTIQWELAERLAARPSTPDFGALSVIVQSLADVEVVRQLPPSAFWPTPKVDSGLVRIEPRPARRARISNLPAFHAFVRALYLHRRKNLRGALWPMMKDRFTKEQLDERLLAHHFDPSGRAESLPVEEHLRLCQAMATE